MICWPQGLVENWPAVLEAVATLLLVIAAGFQWWTMRGQAQQERDRWEREDEIRKEANRPKAAFGFSDNPVPKEFRLYCANLGTVGFLVVGMRIISLQGGEEKILFGKESEIFVPVGTEKQIDFDLNMYKQVCLSLAEIVNSTNGVGVHCGIKLILQGPKGNRETDYEVYRISRTGNAASKPYFVHSWRMMPQLVGASVKQHVMRQRATCPRCKQIVFVDIVKDLGITLPVEDCGIAFEIARKNMVLFLEKGCMNHSRQDLNPAGGEDGDDQSIA